MKLCTKESEIRRQEAHKMLRKISFEFGETTQSTPKNLQPCALCVRTLAQKKNIVDTTTELQTTLWKFNALEEK